ncbi:transglutaminase-like domain-containing protein [Nocardia sp. JCM 34519]|uniref:transglutaminase-like domain-containing protein n=2 Tax=unclassified Nocardia TaxID=2637762 RepID=UPI001CE4283A|nr:transglutaminase-like domain-containing protein [Nocardia sp. JCM 34519]
MYEQMFYASHSPFTDPGAMSWWLDGVVPALPDIHAAAHGLAFHYRANGDITEHGFPAERVHEIDLRYADEILTRLHELDPAPPGRARATTDRVVGCCRDFALLFVTIARHHGIPARSRVGFATYFTPEWAVDHAIAEIWDHGESRWRLVDPELDERDEFDRLDVPRDRFLTGPLAWTQCRSGALDPERFVVAPDLAESSTRSWPQLRYNLLQDLAALNKHEMILWDEWGLLNDPTADELAPKFDALADLLSPVDVAVDQIQDAFEDPAFRVTEVVTSTSPVTGAATRVLLRAN